MLNIRMAGEEKVQQAIVAALDALQEASHLPDDLKAEIAKHLEQAFVLIDRYLFPDGDDAAPPVNQGG